MKCEKLEAVSSDIERNVIRVGFAHFHRVLTNSVSSQNRNVRAVPVCTLSFPVRFAERARMVSGEELHHTSRSHSSTLTDPIVLSSTNYSSA